MKYFRRRRSLGVTNIRKYTYTRKNSTNTHIIRHNQSKIIFPFDFTIVGQKVGSEKIITDP